MQGTKVQRREKGITLIALVVTIIVLLILAGVSIQMLTGETGIIKQAQKAAIATKFAGYKEEMEMNLMGDENLENFEVGNIILLDKNVKKYIPSLIEEDIGKIGIICGKLYYFGDDEICKKVAKSLNIEIAPEEMTTDEFENQMETKAIEESIKKMTGNSFILDNEDGSEQEVGIKLVNKSFGNDWKIITEIKENETVMTYGTGWTYIPSGSIINGLGTLRQGYIIDFSNKKVVIFDKEKHTMLTYGSKLAVTDGLFFEISPAMIEDKEIIKGVTFGGYDKIENAYTDSSFIFDGIDDYIEIPYDSSTELKDGFTFQFYGKFLGDGTHYYDCGQEWDNLSTDEKNKYNDDEIFPYSPDPNYPTDDKTTVVDAGGIMCAWGPGYVKEIKEQSWDAFLRFGYWGIKDKNYGFIYNIGHKNKTKDFITDFSQSDSVPFNQLVLFKDLGINDFSYGKDLNIVVSIDTKNYKQTYYINGEEVASGSYSKASWLDFKQSVAPRLTKYFVGRSSYNNSWAYGNLEVYGLALYNRGLTNTEVKENTNSLVAYHNMLIGKEN